MNEREIERTIIKLYNATKRVSDKISRIYGQMGIVEAPPPPVGSDITVANAGFGGILWLAPPGGSGYGWDNAQEIFDALDDDYDDPAWPQVRPWLTYYPLNPIVNALDQSGNFWNGSGKAVGTYVFQLYNPLSDTYYWPGNSCALHIHIRMQSFTASNARIFYVGKTGFATADANMQVRAVVGSETKWMCANGNVNLADDGTFSAIIAGNTLNVAINILGYYTKRPG